MSEWPALIDHALLIDLLSTEFPVVVASFDRTEKGLLHCEMGAFLRAAERAMDSGRLWEAGQHFRVIERVLREATPEVANAVEVSFLEGLALGEFTEARYRAVRERMPRPLREKFVAMNERWQ